ncbi:hypothetical protein TKK_0018232 [Trichogramma kaykai]
MLLSQASNEAEHYTWDQIIKTITGPRVTSPVVPDPVQKDLEWSGYNTRWDLLRAGGSKRECWMMDPKGYFCDKVLELCADNEAEICDITTGAHLKIYTCTPSVETSFARSRG